MVSGTQAAREQTAVRIPWTQVRLSAWTLVLMLIVITFATFAHTLQAQFVEWDDGEMIYDNPFLHPVTIAHLSHFWTHGYKWDGFYIPLTYTVYALLAVLGGGNLHPALYHAASLLLHIGSSYLVFILGRHLVKKNWAALAGALLFALHPVQVEPVAWAGSLDTVLAGFFSLAALQQYLVWADSEKKSRLRYAIATLLYLFALCAKPSAVIVPLMAWILEVGLLKQHSRQRAALTLAPWIGITMLWVIVTRHAQAVPIEMVTPLWQRPIIAGDALAFYLAKLAIPWPLAANYGRSPTYLFQHGLCLTWLVPLGLALLLWRRRTALPWLWVSAGVFASALLPTLGFLPFIYQLYSTVADRYLYIAMLGPSLALAFGLAQIQAPLARRIVVGIIAAGLMVCVLLSYQQVQVWSNSLTLFTHAVAVNPRSAMMHFNLGNVLREEGNFPEAIDQYRTANLLMPLRPDIHCNLASAYVSERRIPEAIAEYQTALRIDPSFPLARSGLAMVLHTHPHH